MGAQGGVDSKRKLFEQEALPHLDAVYAVALRLVRNRDDADDLVQETILRAFKFFHQFSPGTNCRAWLMTILYNAFRNGYRRSSREPVAANTGDYERELDKAVVRSGAERNDPESLIFGQLMDEEIESALNALAEDFRAAILLVDVQELSYQETAQVLKIPIGTLRSRLSRGRAAMRLKLRELARARGLLRS
jgi:RNA polymerase sigma-70 factor (ECF subfamily)